MPFISNPFLSTMLIHWNFNTSAKGQPSYLPSHSCPCFGFFPCLLAAYQLETLYVAIIALSGLLAFLLLVCLLSCLIRIKKRAKRAAALEKIAHDAGREDEGEAFRQVGGSTDTVVVMMMMIMRIYYPINVKKEVSLFCVPRRRWSRTSPN